MSELLLYVQLAPEFGGTKFGPFDTPEIRFGSDPQKSDIRLPETLGVLPEHVKVIPQRDKSFILAPVERSAGVFVWRVGQKPKPVTSPIAIQAGDGFSLVTAEGPRFTMVLEVPAPTKRPEPNRGGVAGAAKKLSAKGLLGEIKRRGLAAALATEVGHGLNNAWMFIKSGTFLQPRYIIAGVLLVGGWIVAGGTGCAVIKLVSDLGKRDSLIDDLNGDLAMCGADEQDDPTLASVTAAIIGPPDLKDTLEGDRALAEAFGRKLKAILASQDDYAWVYRQTATDVALLRERLAAQGVEPALASVLSYGAAIREQDRIREGWTVVMQDTRGERVCARGALQLTYRQAFHLGLEQVQVDALVDRRTAESDNVDPKKEALLNTGYRATGEEPVFSADKVLTASASRQGLEQCIFIDGEDHRDSVNKLAVALTKEVGPSADRVPATGMDYWIAARLVKLYAADFDVGWEELDLSGNIAPSVVLDNATDDQKRFAIEGAAELLARATAIPCLAVLDPTVSQPPTHLGTLPTKFECFALAYMATYEI
jgi:hypothetical protein